MGPQAISVPTSTLFCCILAICPPETTQPFFLAPSLFRNPQRLKEWNVGSRVERVTGRHLDQAGVTGRIEALNSSLAYVKLDTSPEIQK